MFNTIFWRLVWKEYRQQRALILTLTIVLEVAVFYQLITQETNANSLAVGLMRILPFIFALGCGSSLFAGERENETIVWLRALPHSAHNVYWAKSIFACIGTTLFVIIAITLTGIVSGQYYAQSKPFAMILEVGMILEVLIWSAFCSLYLRNVLTSVVMAAVALAISNTLASLFSSFYSSSREMDEVILLMERIASLFIVTLLYLRNSNHWWDDQPALISRWKYSIPSWLTASAFEARIKSLSRLLWQSLRESGGIVLGIYVTFILSLHFLTSAGYLKYALMLFPAVLGGCTFLADHQRGSFRYFTEQGISARIVLIARLLFWMAAALPGFIGTSIACGILRENNFWQQQGFNTISNVNLPRDVWLYYLLCFAIGQYISLIIRYGLFAPFIATVVGYLIIGQIPKMRWLGFPDWLAIYPWIGCFFAISWLRAADWLAESNSWRQQFKPFAYLVAPAVLYCAGLAFHRAYEIPWVKPPIPEIPLTSTVALTHPAVNGEYREAYAKLLIPATPDEEETTRLYNQLKQDSFELLIPTLQDKDLSVFHYRDMFRLSPAAAVKFSMLAQRWVELSERPSINFLAAPTTDVEYKLPDGVDQNHWLSSTGYISESTLITFVRNWLEQDGRRLEENGDLPAALKRYFASLILGNRHCSTLTKAAFDSQDDVRDARTLELIVNWATLPGQTKESITQAEANCPMLRPDYYEKFTAESQLVRQIKEYIKQCEIYGLTNLSLHSVPVPELENKQISEATNWRLKYFPWERIRSKRFIDHVFRYPETATSRTNATKYIAEKWQENTWGDAHAIRSTLVAQEFTGYYRSLISQSIYLFQLRMRINAYRAEHRQYPQYLSEIEVPAPHKLPGAVEEDADYMEYRSRWRYYPTDSQFLVQMPDEANTEMVDSYFYQYTNKPLPCLTAFIWVPRNSVRQLDVIMETDANGYTSRKEKKWFDTSPPYGNSNPVTVIEDERMLMRHYGLAYPIGPANEEE